jgi:hypothetical protein
VGDIMRVENGFDVSHGRINVGKYAEIAKL